MPTLFVPAPFRKSVEDLSRLEVGAGSVSALLREVDTRYPGFNAQLHGPDGSVKKYIRIFVNGKDIKALDGMETALDTRDEVFIVSAMAGG
ncbi:molybdopterin biosynthesis protein, MoaD [Azotobacter vinelandii CA]|uniref:Molybdopterin biosythesis protein, MoaD n=2 Tax=Azotobacter vinelandii TaxID=354 RepID=C1DI36_AZOVD|nr:MoaD/ThiS family protein [Azotobacter vinelandii]ACO76533.1 molybdopterin biosythesis protein, MoaD [Azotobacter vinelandii DJ]AGK15650.1 molybdopterin biosynthesis protein, MoaD [Azotobacter vinelandii CA]AGK19194.1 molybdopterin biosynthesis protein, MoaD [Azotobacter vinelandii CA6]WKN22302.1 MoaD/ThiS family protein [Azotobacter vinelandii]SFX10155.1 molybdopterin synthase subunit MoaD [Azotobacter vinelandii]